MEESEGFQAVASTITILQQKLSLCRMIMKECEQSAAEAEKEIEEHFAKCITALAVRKATLMTQIEHKVKTQKSNVEVTMQKLEVSIDACKQALKAGGMFYSINKTTAENIWKEITVPIPNVIESKIEVLLPSSLPSIFKAHGRVEDSSRFSQADAVTTHAGSKAGNCEGIGVKAQFNVPRGMCWNSANDCLYVCDGNNNSIRKVTMEGEVSTYVSSHNQQTCPEDIVMNPHEKCFFVTNRYTHTISRVCGNSGSVGVFVGNGKPGYIEGHGKNAGFNQPTGITIDQQTGTLYVSDYYNHVIRRISPLGNVSTLHCKDADMQGNDAALKRPWGVFFDEADQSILVCDYGNNKIKKLYLNGQVSTLCDFERPVYAVITANRTILVSSFHHQLCKLVSQDGKKYNVEVMAGSGKSGRVDGNATDCSFLYPTGIVVHESSHSCFIAEESHTIRRVSFMSSFT